jgi:hypothetical protein
MSFFETLNGGLESFFKELSKSKRLEEKRRENQFNELNNTPFLFSSEYLNTLVDGADKEECETILDYLYRFDGHETGEDETLNILEIDKYKKIEKDIIERLW